MGLLRGFVSSWVIAVLVVLGVIAAANAGCTRSGDVAATEPPADSAERTTLHFFRNPVTDQTFTVRDLDGQPHSPADWRGKVVLINFWATWCGPCRAEIPELVALQHKYRDRLVIVGVAEDDGPIEQVKRFAAAEQINYPVVMLTPEIERLFPGVSAIPTSFVLDREGRVVQKHVGLYPRDLLELETRSLAGLAVNARVEEVDRAQPAKLENAAQATTIPGVDLAKLPPERRAEALQRLNTDACTCGCDFTLAKCRIDDPTCGISLPKARQIVQAIADSR